MFLIKCLLNKDLSYLLYCKDIVKPIYQGYSKTYKTKDIVKPIKTKTNKKKTSVYNICSQMFYKVVVLESFTEFTGKHLRWSHFLTKLQP